MNGQASLVGESIANTNDPTLYQAQRYGLASYRFTVTNGAYLVTLKFAETYQWAGIGSRVFNVKIEGEQVLTAFDMVATVGRFRAVDYTFQTTVSDGLLSIDFASVVGPPAINAIEVEAL